jgi:hypothetical protein
MARHDLKSRPEWLHQQELRDARRQRRRMEGERRG